ncbi:MULTISPECIES: TetR/AcrR family transcriptional regulator [Streptomyces]|uniref:TetR/AcrR family transcriptional regulator n=2 Tax=Streptomyces TaxID=1883 RepID=A0A652LCB6_9ACTN|nr:MULTISPECIES: TetR/AcrR family transcriptional regulator [unclassified Streptomyces]WSS67101.1 TetR/AcrR family transcriptional regulator [Streptomyces sp. NBC_01175]WSS74018.1 TetR/AcrR family transcriptional regulator [Streptomyces sp. NBC_01174]MDX3326475.1 TetR/AcrR family transcriptional regulator [Streptomyces sp. ME02-6979-3A]RPK36839.1 HTH-type transcriptional regulator AcrR [Streptomyces sp. ADI93-02]TXS33742.1 TetR/AcrR family transcriptional regulator [Streptomyces sp. gb1(2016)]
MVTRAESAAVTRRALLDAAAELLDLGGPAAVTLREVGARAGVSRGAPYRHFSGKDSLLTAIATESWQRIGDQVHALRADPELGASEKLRGALLTLVRVGRDRPHLYQMLFRRHGHRPEELGEGLDRVRRQLCGPADDPVADRLRAAGRFQDEFLAVVAGLVGKRNTRHYGALLLTGAHGITDMELSGHLDPDELDATAEELIDTLVRMVADAGRTA